MTQSGLSNIILLGTKISTPYSIEEMMVDLKFIRIGTQVKEVID